MCSQGILKLFLLLGKSQANGFLMLKFRAEVRKESNKSLNLNRIKLVHDKKSKRRKVFLYNFSHLTLNLSSWKIFYGKSV